MVVVSPMRGLCSWKVKPDLAGVVVAVRWAGVDPEPGGDAEQGEDPDRQDDCDEGSHLAPPFLFRNPLDGYLWLLVNFSLLRVTCQAL